MNYNLEVTSPSHKKEQHRQAIITDTKLKNN